MQGRAELLTELASALQSGQVRVVDLTQPLSPATPVIILPPIFGQSPALTVERISYYDDAGPAWYWNTLHLGEHTGTHFDAPVHWITGRGLANNTTDLLPAQHFIGPACVIDVSHEAAHTHDFLLTVERIEAWEAKHGTVPAGAWLLLRTDWSKRNGAEFLNDSPTPGFHPDAVRLLALERNVKGVGVETVGTDAGQAGGFEPPFPAHNIMHGAGKYGLASLANLDQLPPIGAIVVTAPLKIVQGSGSPVRVFALVAG